MIVSFALPDCTYKKGSYSLSGTGLQFSSDGPTVRDGIKALKTAQPNTRVLVAVGGATYTNFKSLNTQCIKDLVDDFGFDGADLDWGEGGVELAWGAGLGGHLATRWDSTAGAARPCWCRSTCCGISESLIASRYVETDCTHPNPNRPPRRAFQPQLRTVWRQGQLPHRRRGHRRRHRAAHRAAQGQLPPVHRQLPRRVLRRGRLCGIMAQLQIHRHQPGHGAQHGWTAA